MIVEELSARLVDIQAGSPWRVLGVLAVLTVLVVPGALNLEVKPSTEAILPGDDPAVESLDSLRAEFYGDTTHVVVQQGDVRKQEVLERLERVENRVEKLENVRSVTSPASMFSQDIPADRDELVEKDYRGTVSNDFDTALVSVRADTQANPSEIDKLHSSLSRIVETEMPSAEYSLTGYNMIDLATFQVIINDFIRITGVSFGAVLLVLYGFFRDPVQMLFPVVPVVFALVWMLGLGGYLGADLTIISMVSAAMIMGLGIDFGIHVSKSYFGSSGGFQNLREGMRELSRGLLGGSLTTGTGFLALLAAQLTGMHALGIFLFTGIISAYIGAVVLLPTVIVLVEGIEPK